MTVRQITDEMLDQLQVWVVQRLTPEESSLVIAIIQEMRRLRTRLARDIQKGDQCTFTRTIAGHQFRCAALAKYGKFCGHHRPRKFKQRNKGCTARNRAGEKCKGMVLKDQLCSTHWQRTFGHDYVREGQGFRCALCAETFDYWAVEGKGRDRIASIKRVARCPTKAQK